MGESFFKNCQELKLEDITQVGGKALGLWRLQAMSYAVPEFLVLPATQLQESDVLCGLDSTWFERVAVRSSGLQEDSAEHSFAGIYDSYLNVSGLEAVKKAVFDVIASGTSERATSYRLQRHLSLNGPGMAVVLQKMIQPKFAGVAFAVNPVNGDLNSVWISLTEGLADRLVSGEIEGKEWEWKNHQFHSKQKATELPLELSFLSEVVRITQELSRNFSAPQDIEWAWDGQKLWLIQCRPVTSKIPRQASGHIIFDNSNIQESYCGVTTPLTFSYASTAYAKVYDQTLRFMGVPKNILEAARFRHENLLGLVRGRVYYNINHWYETLLDLPSFGKRKKEMEDMMGLEKPVDFVKDTSKSVAERLRSIPVFAVLFAKLLWKFQRMEKLVQEFDRWFFQIYNSVDFKNLYLLSDQELQKEIRRLQEAFLEKWGIPIINDLRVMMMMGSVKRALAKVGLESDLKSFMYGAELESVKPTLELHRLAKLIAGNPDLRQAIEEKKGQECLQALQLLHPAFAQEIETYIHRYGDRCMGELKLETLTMRQDCELLFSILRNYVASGLHLKHQLFQSEDSSHLQKKLQKLPAGFRRRLTKKIESLKSAVAHRELLRFHRTRNFGLMRCLYLELGRQWQIQAILADGRDIFYLTMAEIEAFGTARSVQNSLQELVSLRKKEWSQYSEKSVPAQVTLDFPAGVQRQAIENADLPQAKMGQVLQGLACSGGTIEGEIRLVRDPHDTHDVAGKILLAERTDPGWTPLFALVKGIIVERGSMLSHSAVIAREMGIPGILAVPRVTEILQEGDYVRLDGNQGSIEILRRRDLVSDSTAAHETSPLQAW